MVRARLAMMTLAIGLAAASGCALPNSCCQVTTPHADCACNNNPYGIAGGGVSGFETGVEGPILMQPEGGYVPPMPSTNEPPRIVPVPQANPYPYSPTGLRRLFSREP